MADSDEDYVADDQSDDDIRGFDDAHGTRSTGRSGGPVGSATRGGDREAGNTRRRAAWEDIKRSWDDVVEGADGSINSTIEGLREAGKRKRFVYCYFFKGTSLISESQGYFETLLLSKEALSGISFSSSTSPSP
jgi:hypothetical protein